MGLHKIFTEVPKKVRFYKFFLMFSQFIGEASKFCKLVEIDYRLSLACACLAVEPTTSRLRHSPSIKICIAGGQNLYDSPNYETCSPY